MITLGVLSIGIYGFVKSVIIEIAQVVLSEAHTKYQAAQTENLLKVVYLK